MADNQKLVSYQTLHPSSDDYQKIADMITNKYIKIENIVKIHNPTLKQAYYEKWNQKKSNGPVTEHWLFHGTKKVNLESICTYNFDWRQCKVHKYGKGVYFTHNAKYASNYCDNNHHKVLVLTKVLVGNVYYSQKDMDYPPQGYDTVQRDDSTIIVVKFSDNEFLPAYKIYYHFEEDEDEDDYSYSSDSDEWDSEWSDSEWSDLEEDSDYSESYSESSSDDYEENYN